MWFTPAEPLLAVPMGFRPSNSRYSCNSSAFVKAWSAFSGFNFLNSHLRVELFNPSIKLVTTICSSKRGGRDKRDALTCEYRTEMWQYLVQVVAWRPSVELLKFLRSLYNFGGKPPPKG